MTNFETYIIIESNESRLQILLLICKAILVQILDHLCNSSQGLLALFFGAESMKVLLCLLMILSILKN
jgi:hypothetical protein